MIQKVLFEIPIYSMTEKEFNKRWEKKLQKDLERMKPSDKEKAKKQLMQLYYPQYVWRFNQIIGYIKLSVTKRDVLFNIYLAKDQRFYAVSKRKKFIEDTRSHGLRFYVGDKSDEEIKAEIYRQLKNIKNERIRRSFYIDYSVFNNIINYLNIKKIIDSM